MTLHPAHKLDAISYNLDSQSTCLVCASERIAGILDLGLQPFADTFVSEKRAGEPDAIFPLSCNLCSECGHVQNACLTPPRDRYALHDYSYTSANSRLAKKHWNEFAGKVSAKTGLGRGAFVLEIASNDGYLAEQFQNRGCRVLGVDPSVNIARLAESRGIETVVDFFSSDLAQALVAERGQADLVVANNVLNHANAPLDFACGVAMLLANNGTFIFEVPYWLANVREKRFDQIYHEHVSQFTVRSLRQVLTSVGLRIFDIEVVDYHGGSLRVYAGKGKDDGEEGGKVSRMIAEETAKGLFEVGTYESLRRYLLKQREEFLEKVHQIRRDGDVIIGVGAAAKANTFLNFYGLGRETISFITDASRFKQGKYMPFTRIPVVSDEVFKNHESPYALILAWNISSMLEEAILAINPSVRFLRLPRPDEQQPELPVYE